MEDQIGTKIDEERAQDQQQGFGGEDPRVRHLSTMQRAVNAHAAIDRALGSPSDDGIALKSVSHAEAWLQRVILEAQDLNNKIMLLERFLVCPPTSIAALDVDLLRVQLELMKSYWRVLIIRINRSSESASR